MIITKVFTSGNSQAVRIPKEFRFNSDEVEITKENGVVIIRERQHDLSDVFELFGKMSDDAFDFERNDNPPQKRDFFK